MQFISYSWAKRIDLIEGALPEVLAALTYKSPTSLVVERLAARLGVEDNANLSNTLLKIAGSHPLASHDGSEFKSFGKTARRWMWSPGNSSGWRFRKDDAPAPRATPEAIPGMSDIDSAYLLDELNAKRAKVQDGEGADMLDWLIQLVEDARDADPYDPDALELGEPNADDIFG